MKDVKYGMLIQVKQPVYACYPLQNYTKDNCPPWMKSHNGRGFVKGGPYVEAPDENNLSHKTKVVSKYWDIKWENTGQSVTICEDDFDIIK